MGQTKGWKEILPAELRGVNHFVETVGCLLVEARPPVGVDERIVGDILVQKNILLVFEGFSLFL